MHLKSLLIGLVLGAAIATGVLMVFGDDIRGNVADTTEDIGRGVEKAGETIKESAKKLDE
jgi:gas vesicle protein